MAFPGHYGALASALAADPANKVVFLTATGGGGLPGVDKRVFKAARGPGPHTHHYLHWLESAVLNGQAVYRACTHLKSQGFTPDVVCAHAGWGPGLYVKEAFPDSPLLGYFEWYYHPRGSDADFLDPVGEDDACRLRTRNAAILLDLAECDGGVTPTAFQRDRFPAWAGDRLTVLHDGVDTDFFAPIPAANPVLPGVDLSGVGEIVTYATRGMEPYRGFPQFMRALALVQRRRPGLHAVVVGDDRVVYGRQLKGGYRRRMLEELPELDLTRLHFTGSLPYDQYLRVLRASSVHVYLTVPFVLSWSLMEALSTGCLVVASDTAPVREVMTDGVNGLLVPFHDHHRLAERIMDALDQPERGARLRTAARAAMVRQYALKDLLPRHLGLIGAMAGGQGSRPEMPPKTVAL